VNDGTIRLKSASMKLMCPDGVTQQESISKQPGLPLASKTKTQLAPAVVFGSAPGARVVSSPKPGSPAATVANSTASGDVPPTAGVEMSQECEGGPVHVCAAGASKRRFVCEAAGHWPPGSAEPNGLASRRRPGCATKNELPAGPRKKAPPQLEESRAVFLNDLLQYGEGFEESEKEVLKETLSALWDEFSEDYSELRLSDLEGKFSRFILIRPESSDTPE